jgi:hypothetical protein
LRFSEFILTTTLPQWCDTNSSAMMPPVRQRQGQRA